MRPSKLDLLARWLPEQSWYHGAADRLTRAGGFRLDDPAGEVGIEFLLVLTGDGRAFQAQAQSESHTLDPTVHVRPDDGVTSVGFPRLLAEDETPPERVGYASATWRRLDGSLARSVVAIGNHADG